MNDDITEFRKHVCLAIGLVESFSVLSATPNISLLHAAIELLGQAAENVHNIIATEEN